MFGTPLEALNNLGGQWTRRVDNINENLVGLVRKVLTTRYGEESNNSIITIDEAVKEINEGTGNKDNKKDGGDSINNKRNIMDFLGGK